MRGRIVRGIGGFYYVQAGETIYECKAKGIFRKEQIKPLPGDFVEIRVLNEAERLGNLERICPRKNVLIRPAVANVNQALVIFACDAPAPNFNLLDRFLVMMEKQGLKSVLLFNKKDLVSDGAMREIAARYAGSGYELHFVSAACEEGIGTVRNILRGKTTTVAGPSGVGKSSLINRLQDGLVMQTGEISEKIQRGRHTTRHTELLFVEEDTWILDTPGFSSVELSGITKEELGSFFPEIAERQNGCRFVGCSHLTEPGCRVRDALASGEISQGRYGDYRAFYEELKARRKY